MTVPPLEEDDPPGEREDASTLQPDEVDDLFRGLLEALRTSMPGVTVLFGFLLVLPFQAPFVETSGVAQAAYMVAFYAAGIAAVLLSAPSVHQWVRAPRTGLRRRHLSHVHTAVRLALAGSLFFLVALVASVFLVSLVVFESVVASVASAVLGGAAIWAWFYLPLVAFERRV